MQVEVAYALPEAQTLLTLEVEPGCTLAQAVRLSGILQLHPEIDLQVNRVGVFSRLESLDYPLRPQDRIEIYRKLIADPKEVRRQRAKQRK